MRSPVRWVGLSTAMLCLLSPLAAEAQPAAPGKEASASEKDLAKEWAQKGRDFFNRGQYQDAIAALREAERHFAAPTIVRLRAEAHEKLGQLVEARKAYKQVADVSLPEGASPQLVAAQQSAKAALLGIEERLGTIEIAGAPSGALISLDGAPLSAGDLGHPIQVDPGKHVVTMEAPGRGRVTRELQLAEKAREKVVFEGEKAAPPPEKAPPPPPPPPSAPGNSRVLPGIAFGVGGAGLALGAVTGILTITKMDEVRKTCGEKLWCPADYRGDVEGAKTIGHVSTVGFIVGAVGVAAGVVVLALPKKHSPARAGLLLGPGFAGVKGAF